jgi:hypothetical protein
VISSATAVATASHPADEADRRDRNTGMSPVLHRGSGPGGACDAGGWADG